MPTLPDYTDKAGIAELIGVSPRTLDRWWNERRGPPRVKLGHKVLYHRPSVLDWVKSQEQMPVRQRAAGGRV